MSSIYRFATGTTTFLQVVAIFAVIVSVAIIFAKTKSAVPTVTTAILGSFAVWAVNNAETLERLAEEELGADLGSVTPAQAESFTAKLIPVAQYGSVLICIVVVLIVFAKTKSAVPTIITAVIAGLVAWFVFNVPLSARKVGEEFPGVSGGIYVPVG